MVPILIAALETMARTFDTEMNINWYRSPIDADVLKELMQRDDLRGWIQTIGHLGFFFATAALAYVAYLNIDTTNWYWSSPLLLLALFVHGTMGPFMGLIAVHELQHRTVFKSRRLNEFFKKVYSFISWSDYLWYQKSHAAHHRATCHAAYDGEVLLPIKFSMRRWQFWLGLFGWNPRVSWAKLKMIWRHANGRIQGVWYEHVLPASDQRLRAQHRNWARTLLIGHAILALIFIATGHWFLIVVFTFGTYYCAWLGFLCGIPQHFGLNSNIPDFRYNTRTFTCSWLPAFYYWNMQYHLEHHMYPAVPFYNLPKLRKAIEKDLPPVTHGLFATWRDLVAIRVQLKSDPDYRYIPEVPGQDAIPVSSDNSG